MKEKVIIQFICGDFQKDLEVPLDITADEFIYAIQNIVKVEDFLTSENPIALIKGDQTLEEIGIRNGSIIYGRRKS
ncbi:MAG: EsaB/YukD family protein [Lachnospiraceae bacterium]|nr:EsaB/YukD family protein [Lachnospiraceae bacterium]